MIVGLSISQSPDLLRLGFSDLHLEDAMREIARHLLAQKYRLAYGGDLQPSGFTRTLRELAAAYMDGSKEQPILNFLAWHVWKEAPKNELATLGEVGELMRQPEPAEAKADPKPPEAYVRARALTEMRQAMNARIDARLLLGGKITGFKGRMPGLIEEAWLAVETQRPLYLLGAFGGCTREIIQAVKGDTPEAFSPEFQAARTPGKAALIQEHDARLSADEGSGALKRAREALGRAGVSGLSEVNGLTGPENEVLFTTEHLPVAIALVLKGLQQVQATRSRDT